MIIRLKDNSIRIRLTKTEVNHVCFLGRLETITQFSGKSLKYVLARDNDAFNLSAQFEENTIIVTMPGESCDEWVNTAIVGYNHTQKNEDGSELYILIEKNFDCLDGSGKEEGDNFENPNAIC